MFDPEFRKGFPNVQRWYLTLLHFPHFDAVFQVKELAKERIKGMLLLSAHALTSCNTRLVIRDSNKTLQTVSMS